MENTDNNEIIVKKKTSEAMKAAQKRYYNKKRENKQFQERRRAYSKKHYDNNKEKVINRVQNYQQKVLELEQLYELQQQGLINYDTGKINDEQYEKYNKKLFDKLAHLHLSS